MLYISYNISDFYCNTLSSCDGILSSALGKSTHGTEEWCCPKKQAHCSKIADHKLSEYYWKSWWQICHETSINIDWNVLHNRPMELAKLLPEDAYFQVGLTHNGNSRQEHLTMVLVTKWILWKKRSYYGFGIDQLWLLHLYYPFLVVCSTFDIYHCILGVSLTTTMIHPIS